MSEQSGEIILGWAAPPVGEQHPVLPQSIAEHFDEDSKAISRLFMREMITLSQRDQARAKLVKKIETAIRAALKAAS